MGLRSETRDVLKEIEELTGYPVEIVEGEDQPLLAQISRARAERPFHLLRVNSSIEQPDYLIIYQCGFVLRLYQTSPEDRREFAGTVQGHQEVDRLVKRAGQTAQLPDPVKGQFVQKFLDGLLTQLRSYPIDMRINGWVHKDFPGLEALQREAIARQQQDNLAVFNQDVRKLTPKAVVDANASMNAVYAIFCDREFGKVGYSIPYRSTGYEKRGRALLKILESVPDDPAHDFALVDAWAAELGLSGWYQWITTRA